MSLNYEELKQKNAPQKAASNDMIAKMEQASQVTIVDDSLWKSHFLCQFEQQLLAGPPILLRASALKGEVCMNPKIKKINTEYEKNAARITELQARQEELSKQRVELENLDIIGLVRGMGLDPDQLAALMQASRAPEKEDQSHGKD